jgi:hypothetical protein
MQSTYLMGELDEAYHKGGDWIQLRSVQALLRHVYQVRT